MPGTNEAPSGCARRPCWIGMILVGAISWRSPSMADPTGPGPNDRRVTLAVAALLPREHLTRHPLDDEISRRMLTMFLDKLDPSKLYFRQSDVDGFLDEQNYLDDQVRRGELDFAYQAFGVFLKRVDERMKLVEELLVAEHDFTVDEELATDPELAAYAEDEAEFRERWRKRIKLDLLLLKVEGVEGRDAIDTLRRRYQAYGKRMHETENRELLEMYLDSLASAFDPQSTYLSPAALEGFRINSRGSLEGIGAALRVEDDWVTVTRIIPGGAADRDGRLRVDDRIVGVGQGPEGQIERIAGKKLAETVGLIRGPRGSVVRLEVISSDSPEPKVIDISRGTVALVDANARGNVFTQGHKPDGDPFKVGIIEVPDIYVDSQAARSGAGTWRSVARDVRRILEEFRRKKVDAVVVDVRRAGSDRSTTIDALSETINLAGLFLDQGPVVQVKDGDGRVETYRDLDAGAAWDGPLVVLTSKLTGGPGEILAAAIQDHQRGLIVGDPTTSGMGTVQAVVDLATQLFRVPKSGYLGALQVTVRQSYRPGGESIQQRGVLADVVLPSLTAQFDVGEPMDHAIPADEVKPVAVKTLGLVDAAMCKRLGELSSERRSESPDFKELDSRIKRYRRQIDRKSIPLEESQFLKERSQPGRDEAAPLLRNGDEPMGFQDYYGEEVVAIAIDYLQLISKGEN